MNTYYAELDNNNVCTDTKIGWPEHYALAPKRVITDSLNYIGMSWDDETQTWSGTPYIPPPPIWEWFIDLGPFFDRFGSAKLAVLTSTDPVVKAIINDVQIRKWIDLKRQDVIESLAYIGSSVPALTPQLIATILNTPVTEEENHALRKVYF